jgi:Mannosyltransferase (PIG-V)
MAARISLALLALICVTLIPANEPADVPGWPAPEPDSRWSAVGTAWERWDGLWFLRIAEDGYSENDGSAAFFPLYPMATKVVSTLIGGHPLPASLIVSNVAFFLALVVFYLLSRLEFGKDTAERSVLYMAIFPTAFFFFAPYSESLFLLCAAACILFARLGRWPQAGLVGALACATRSIGLVLIPALIVEAVLQIRSRPRPERAGAMVAPAVFSLMPALGTFAYLLYWQLFGGDWLAPVGEQGNWLREFSWLPVTLRDGTRGAVDFIGVPSGGYYQLDWILVAALIAASVWVVMRSRPTYAVYTVLSLLLPLSFVFVSRPFMSVPRFALVVWPLFWALAAFARTPGRHNLVVAASAAGLGVMTLLFVNWYFVF